MNANFNFRYLRNIESSFQLLRVLVFIIIVGCLSFAAWIGYMSFKSNREARQKIYVLDNDGKSLMLALAQEQNVNRPAEAKDHVKTFLGLFFNLSPEAELIDENMKQAVYLGDESITRQYYDLREKGFYTKLLQGNMTQKIFIDSMKVDMTKSPYYCTIIARLRLVRASNITMRKLKADCYLVDATRSDNNPHGFLIEHFEVTDNSDIETIQRDQSQSRQ